VRALLRMTEPIQAWVAAHYPCSGRPWDTAKRRIGGSTDALHMRWTHRLTASYDVALLADHLRAGRFLLGQRGVKQVW
jgi:hypothetical protein